MDVADESDSDSSSSSIKSIDALDDFREKWQQEIENKVTHFPKEEAIKRTALTDKRKIVGTEDKARKLFLEAAELEKLGKVFEAMHLYRQATHIVPDIEFKIYESTKKQNVDNGKADLVKLEANQSDLDKDIEDLTDVDLFARFQTSIQNGNGGLFQKSNADKGVITTGAHLADLPIELIFYILRWVVSLDLDMLSLEQCSMVSKGFYLCARDAEIWRLACLKVWGLQASVLKSSGYSSWRQMYIDRPRICFNGCYISKTSYFRYGERSFQDQYYRPVHLIEYYRYMRFFSDGTALMMTTADEPGQSVGKLKYKNVQRHDVLRGHYRYKDDVVVLLLKKSSGKSQYNRSYHTLDTDANENTFCIQLEISHTKRRNIPQLIWKQYSLIQTHKYEEVNTEFDITTAKHPPLILSRVRSYESTSEMPI